MNQGLKKGKIWSKKNETKQLFFKLRKGKKKRKKKREKETETEKKENGEEK